MAAARPRVTAAVCAYNEAASIEQLLRKLLSRDSAFFDELLVVSSGSTDGTDGIVRGMEAEFPGLRLISEPERRGKASAVNTALSQAQGDVLLLIDADCLPAEGCLERLLARLAGTKVGGVGCRNVVTNAGSGWMSRAGEVLWDLHHLVCMRKPVLGGDIVAFRAVVGRIPAEAVNDDYAIEATLRSQGYDIAYEPEARVLMKAPATVLDFLRQRRRIYAGFRAETREGLVKPTQDWRLACGAVATFSRSHPGRLPVLMLLLGLEALARLSMLVDAVRGKRGYYTAWEPALSTKGRLPESASRERAP